jgi:hypothetical protein
LDVVQDFDLSLCFDVIRIHFPELGLGKKLSKFDYFLYKIQDCRMFFYYNFKARLRITSVYEYAKLMQI